MIVDTIGVKEGSSESAPELEEAEEGINSDPKPTEAKNRSDGASQLKDARDCSDRTPELREPADKLYQNLLPDIVKEISKLCFNFIY